MFRRQMSGSFGANALEVLYLLCSGGLCGDPVDRVKPMYLAATNIMYADYISHVFIGSK